MKAETRFPRTVEAYKAHLHEDRPHYDSFQTFCRKQGVRYKGVMQWMHRHNRSIGSLRLEVLLEKNGNDSNLKSSLIEVSRQSFPNWFAIQRQETHSAEMSICSVVKNGT